MTTAMTRATIAIVRVSMARPYSVSRAVSPDPPSGTPLALTHGLGRLERVLAGSRSGQPPSTSTGSLPAPPRSDGARVRATRRGGSELVRSGREPGTRGDARIVDEQKPWTKIRRSASRPTLVHRCVAWRRGADTVVQETPHSARAATSSTFRSVAAPREHAREWLRAVAPAAPSLPVACAAARFWFGGWHSEAGGLRSRPRHEAVTVS